MSDSAYDIAYDFKYDKPVRDPNIRRQELQPICLRAVFTCFMTCHSTCVLTCDSALALACDAPGQGILLRLHANAGTKSQVKSQVESQFMTQVDTAP
jgi:hypothetical protein